MNRATALILFRIGWLTTGLMQANVHVATRQCVSLTVARSLKGEDVVAALKKAVARRGAPQYIRSDNGPEFIAEVTREHLEKEKIKTLYIDPGSPWQPSSSEIDSHKVAARRVVPAGTIKTGTPSRSTTGCAMSASTRNTSSP